MPRFTQEVPQAQPALVPAGATANNIIEPTPRGAAFHQGVNQGNQVSYFPSTDAGVIPVGNRTR
jgi:hypothetical protein